MQAVTNDQGQKGFYDESLGFIPVDSLQQVTDPQGQKGYWSGKTGFIPAPAETSSLSKWREKWAGKESFTGLNEASDTASEKISKIWSPKGNESVLQSGLKIPGRVFDTAGELAGAGTKVIGQTAVNAAKGIYNVTTPEETKKMEAETFQAFLDTPIAKTGVAALQQGQKYFDLFAKTHPDAARHLIEGFNLFGAGAFNKSFKVLGEAFDLPKTAESAKTALTSSESEKLINLVKRDVSTMTKEERIEALKTNKMEKPGVFKQSAIKTTKQDEEIADSIMGIVDVKKSPVENINNIYKEIGVLAEKTKALPAENDKIFNNKQIRSYLSKAKNDTSVILPGDKNLSKIYDSVVTDFMNILDKKPNKLSSVLEARKEFDALMKYKNRKVFDRAGAVIDQARKDVRDLANEFVSESLPEGNEFKLLLKKQTNLYRAAERIAKNNPEVGKSTIEKAGDFIRKHPYISTGVAGTLGYEGGRKINALLP